MNANGDVQLCDFGLSRIRHVFDRSLTTRVSGGRLSYMAPENTFDRPRVNGEDDEWLVNEASDIYSFAMVMYALAVGHAPFKDVNELQVLQDVRSGIRPILPRQFRNLSATYIQGFSTCMVAMWNGIPNRRPDTQQVEQYLSRDIFNQVRYIGACVYISRAHWKMRLYLTSRAFPYTVNTYMHDDFFVRLVCTTAVA